MKDLLRKSETKIPNLALESFNEFQGSEKKEMSADFLPKSSNCQSMMQRVKLVVCILSNKSYSEKAVLEGIAKNQGTSMAEYAFLL